MKARLLFAALAAAPTLCAAADAGTPVVQDTKVTVPSISQQTLQRIRSSLVGQIAAYEPAERAMRAPTTEEAAVLSGASPSGPPTVVRLPGGGAAMQGDMSTASFAVVRRLDDGRLVIDHDVSLARKGPAHAR